jgi:predicted aspartyl protease
VKFKYDRSYRPPAPVITIQLAVPGEPFSVGPLSAFVDTGADGTIVPLRYLSPLGLTVDNRKYLRSQWGERRVVDICVLEVGIADVRLPLTEIVADQLGNEVIVGRNLLNHLVLTLNGPEQVVRIRA